MSTVEFGFKTLLQAELDDLMFSTAMQLSQESDAGFSREEYKGNVVCGSLRPVVLDCDQILFGVEAIPIESSNQGNHLRKRFDETFVGGWNTGCSSATVVVEFMYPLPVFIWPFGIVEQVEYEGGTYMRSRTIIRREPLSSGTGTTEGGVPC